MVMSTDITASPAPTQGHTAFVAPRIVTVTQLALVE
jgi:hypothetical protein